jgi:hypothetical protein
MMHQTDTESPKPVAEAESLVGVASTDLLAIFDERGRPLKIGMRVGGRYAGEPRLMSRRGIILEGYEPGHPEPYLTNAGRFPLVLIDHQPDMDQWIADHVSR